MRQLLLMRHAKSSWDDPRLSDHARPLNPRGRAAATTMRAVMRDLGLVPDVVLVSSARRTLQTLEALEPWEDTPLVEPMDALYLADPSQILQLVGKMAETVRSIMILGHNPGIHELALRLAGNPAADAQNPELRHLADGFPSGALAEFSVAGTWATLGEESLRGMGSGIRLHRFIRPRDMPATGS